MSGLVRTQIVPVTRPRVVGVRIATHLEADADVTVGVVDVPGGRWEVMEVDPWGPFWLRWPTGQ
mgnify:CR=1 FL=1